MKKQGFTLIELLVVIAIIAILAAILFPVFIQVKEKSRQTACLSNMQQIGTAGNMYLQDWRDVYPRNGGPTVGWPYSDTSIATKILKYAKNGSIFTCPSDATKGIVKGKNCSYATNWWMGPALNFQAVTTASIIRPSRVVHWTDSVSFVGYNTIEQHNWQNQFDWGTPTRHTRGINITFADGHAQWYELVINPPSRTQKGISYLINYSR